MNSGHIQELRMMSDNLESVGASVSGMKKKRVKMQMRLNVLNAKKSLSLTEKEENEKRKLRIDVKKNFRNLLNVLKGAEQSRNGFDKKAAKKTVEQANKDVASAKKKEQANKTVVAGARYRKKTATNNLKTILKDQDQLKKERKKREVEAKAAVSRDKKKKEIALWQNEISDAENFIVKAL